MKREHKAQHDIKQISRPDVDRDDQHPSLRRQTEVYLQKKDLVKDIWIGSGMIIIFMPLSIQMTMLLATVFLSFCILDETEDF